MKLLGTMKNNDGILEIGGIPVTQLAKEYQTPLYIMDQQLIEDNIKKYKQGFKSSMFNTSIVYAAKAFLSVAMCQIVGGYGLEIDAVSGGELYTIKKSGFPMEKVHMHGNNKSQEELEMCVDYGIGLVMIDNELEISRLQDVLEKKNKHIKAMLRVNIGIDAHTHEYIKTSKNSSKFGESIFDERIETIVKKIIDATNIELVGFHCHIGSQIFDMKAFFEAVDTMLNFTKKMADKFNAPLTQINLGGGFGVYYTDKDVAVDLEKASKMVIEHLEKSIKEKKVKITNVSMEPGRSIVANAGSTLYTVGGIKSTYGGIKYIFIDGGMADNIRPALYQAEYEAVIANKMNDKPSEVFTVAGKCCESGDLIVKNYKIAVPEPGDLLITPTTGAYGYSMSSNYNKAPTPAVVFVKDGKSQISIKRETYEDLARNEEKIKL